MAIVSKKANNNGSDKKESNFKNVDLTDKGLSQGTKSKLDPSKAGEAWEWEAPPPAGLYWLKLFKAKEFARHNEEDDYYSLNFEGRIINHSKKEYNNIPVFSTVSTKVGKRKNISTAAALLILCKVKVPDEATDLEIARLIDKWVKSEPIVAVRLDWQGYSKNDARVIFNKMEDFPLSDDGESYLHLVTITNKDGNKEEIRASLKVKDFYGKKMPEGVEGVEKGKEDKKEEVFEEEKEDSKKEDSKTKNNKEEDNSGVELEFEE